MYSRRGQTQQPVKVMQEKRCPACNKALPVDYQGEKCSLCAIGLTPTKTSYIDLKQSSDLELLKPASGRILSGVFCPQCGAEFNVLDLKRLSCSICGEAFTPKKMAELIRIASSKPVHKFRTPVNSGAGSKNWPDDAPIW